MSDIRHADLTLTQCRADADGHCVTCSDEALEALVLQVDIERGLALVAMGAETAEVDISLVDEPQPGGRLLVHAGVAVALLEGQE